MTDSEKQSFRPAFPRFSIDLDFYTTDDSIHRILKEVSERGSLKQVGYGVESDNTFKRYDSPIPAKLEKCTVAFLKS